MLLSAMLCFSGTLASLAQGDTWVQKSDLGYTAINKIWDTALARYAATGFSIGNKGYIGTGLDSSLDPYNYYSYYFNDFWEFDPATNTWTQKANFGGVARAYAVGFSIGTKGYIGTGRAGYPDYAHLKDFWEYDPSSNTWKQIADFGGTARRAAVGFGIGVKGYVGTGNDGLNRKKDFWEYDPAKNIWKQKANFGGAARFLAAGFNIDNK